MRKGDEKLAGKAAGDMVFQKLLSRKAFWKDLLYIRMLFGIPYESFNLKFPDYGIDVERYNPSETNVRFAAWYQVHIATSSERLYGALSWLLRRHHLPTTTWWQKQMLKHVVGFEPIIDQGEEHPCIEVLDYSEDERGHYTDLRIYEGATTRDMEAFVNEYWSTIKDHRNPRGPKSRQPERPSPINDRIAELAQLSKDDLYSMCDKGPYEKKLTRDTMIARIVKKEAKDGVFGELPETDRKLIEKLKDSGVKGRLERIRKKVGAKKGTVK